MTVRVEWTKDSGGRWKMEEVPGSEKYFPAQLVFLALGFLGPQVDLVKELGLKQDARSNIQTPHKVMDLDVYCDGCLSKTLPRNILQAFQVSLLLEIAAVANLSLFGVSSACCYSI
jgi:hypothetical protein